MLCIMLVKKIPKIGGNIAVALGAAGFIALLMGGIYNPLDWLKEWISGVDRIAWVMGLSIFGSIYSETQTELGALETVLSMLRAKFGRSPKGMIVVIIISLGIAGSLLGDSIAASTVVGVLTIGAMFDLGLSGELITGIIVIGASLGSIMPPITQAIFLSASLLGISPDWAVQPAYITVGIGIVFVCWFVTRFYLKKDMKLPEHLIPEKTAGQIFKERWKTLIPLFVLIFCILCRSFPKDVANLDFISGALNAIKIGDKGLLQWLGGITIIKMFSNTILICIILATIVSYLFKKVRQNGAKPITTGLKNVRSITVIQLAIGLMMGGFYAGGTITAVQEFAQGLDTNALIWGGGIALTIMGMLTGTQSAGQSALFVFLGPALVAAGFHPVNAAIYGSHLAAAGQGLPPADLMCFVVSGLVGGQIGKKVDPVKSMLYAMCFSIYLFVAGMIMIYMPAWPTAAPV